MRAALADVARTGKPELRGQALAQLMGTGAPTEAARTDGSLDRAATANVGRARDAAHPARWPVAGPGAREVPVAPLLRIADDGLAPLDGEEVPPPELVALLASARRTSGARILLVHLLPSAASEQVRTLMARAGAAGFAELGLIARIPAFPWSARAYRIAVGAGLPVRDADTVQVLVRFLDR